MDVFFEDCFQKCFTVPLYDVQKRENKTGIYNRLLLNIL